LLAFGNGLTRLGGTLFGDALGVASHGEEMAWHKNAAGHAAASAGYNIRSFGASQRGQGYQTMAGRMNQQAGYESEMAGWEFARDFAASKAGTATVIGVFAGGMAPGNKPFSMEGMSAKGEFGQPAKNAFYYPTSQGKGGMFGQVASGERQLYGAVGPGKMQQEFNGRYAGSVPAEIKQSTGAMRQLGL
jgi:hypothetical protein